MRPIAALALAAALAGCAPWGPRGGTPATSAPAPSVRIAESKLEPKAERVDSGESLVKYLARVGAMSPAALAAEAAAQRQAAQRRPGDLARVKAAIAIILAHPEDAEIHALVDPVVRRDPGGELGAMASFLQVLAADRRRLRESAAARVREERRAQEALRTRAEAAQERAAELQQKLDALTELEKSLTERQPSSR